MLNPQKFPDDSQRPVETACLRALTCGLHPPTSAPQCGFSADLGLSGRPSSPSADAQWQSRLTALPPLCFLSDRLEGLAEWPDQISEGLWGGYNALANGQVFWKKKKTPLSTILSVILCLLPHKAHLQALFPCCFFDQLKGTINSGHCSLSNYWLPPTFSEKLCRMGSHTVTCRWSPVFLAPKRCTLTRESSPAGWWTTWHLSPEKGARGSHRITALMDPELV